MPSRRSKRRHARPRTAQLNCWRWRGASTQSPCSSSTATRTNSSISTSASSSSSSPSSCGVGGGEPGEVGQRFAAFLRQRRRVARGQAEAAEEAAAPVEQRAAALAQRCVGVGQQQLEAETAVVQLRWPWPARRRSSALSAATCGSAASAITLRQPVAAPARRRRPASRTARHAVRRRPSPRPSSRAAASTSAGAGRASDTARPSRLGVTV